MIIFVFATDVDDDMVPYVNDVMKEDIDNYMNDEASDIFYDNDVL